MKQMRCKFRRHADKLLRFPRAILQPHAQRASSPARRVLAAPLMRGCICLLPMQTQ